MVSIFKKWVTAISFFTVKIDYLLVRDVKQQEPLRAIRFCDYHEKDAAFWTKNCSTENRSSYLHFSSLQFKTNVENHKCLPHKLKCSYCDLN